jgi:glutamine---fructose-6-phosphate transaminase (isomerizing)
MTTPTVMREEIDEQPLAVERTLSQLLPMRVELSRLLRGRRQVLFVARGSSDNAAVFGRYLLETHAGHSASLAAPSVATHYRARLDLSDTVVVAVSQSGRTAEILEAVAWARACGARTIGVTNQPASPLVAACDLGVVTAAGPERAVPATKSHLTQLVAMAVLATAVRPDPGMDDVLHSLPDRLAAQLAQVEQTRAGAALLAGHTGSILVTGRGLLLGAAQEVALKLEETCLRPIRSYSYADLRHGPIAVVGAGTLAVVLASPTGPLADPMAELVEDLRARDAEVVGLGGTPRFRAACQHAFADGDAPEWAQGFVQVVAAQAMIEATARLLGLDPDRPRGLAKVTRTDMDGG